MNTYRRAAAALSPLHLVAQRERSARARLKEKLQNAAYKQETVKWDSDSDSDESDDDEDLKVAGRVGGLAPASARSAGSWAGSGCAGLHLSEYTGIHTYLLLGL